MRFKLCHTEAALLQAALSECLLLSESARMSSLPGLCLIVIKQELFAANSQTSLVQAVRISSRLVPVVSTCWLAALSVMSNVLGFWVLGFLVPLVGLLPRAVQCLLWSPVYVAP